MANIALRQYGRWINNTLWLWCHVLITQSFLQRKLCHTDIHFDETVMATSCHTYHLLVLLCSPPLKYSL